MRVDIFLEFNTGLGGPCQETNECRDVFNAAHYPALLPPEDSRAD